MSLVYQVDVFCDGNDCHEWTEGGQTSVAVRGDIAKQVRDKAKAAGWQRRMDAKGSYMDLCPRCAQKLEEERKARP